MWEFFSNIKENWPTISLVFGAFGAALTFSWRFILGGWNAVKQAKTDAEVSAGKAKKSADKLTGATQTLESFQFQIEQLNSRLATAEFTARQRDSDYLRLEGILNETQQQLGITQHALATAQATLEHTAEQLSMVQVREAEKDKVILKLTNELKEVRTQFEEAKSANASLASRLEADHNQTTRNRNRKPERNAE
jgi:chromosome segregation ATPase